MNASEVINVSWAAKDGTGAVAPGLTQALCETAGHTAKPDASAPVVAHRCANNEEFFSRHYARVRRVLNEFAHRQKDSRTASDRPAAIRAAVKSAGDVLVEGLAVVGQRACCGSDGSPRSLLALASQLQDALRQSENPAFLHAADQMQVHLNYFRQHVADENLETVADHPQEAAYVQDFLHNYMHTNAQFFLNFFSWISADPRTTTQFFDTSAVEASLTDSARQLLEDVKVLEGWCSPQKALMLYSLIRSHRPQTVVEIGIYGGRSIVPMAAALRDNGTGVVHGIETWSGSAATSYRTCISNDFWWLNVDFSLIKGQFLEFIVRQKLHDTIKIVEASSDRACVLYDRIDMLHIDGAHSTYAAAQDVINYVNKVPPGGIVVYDDIDWPSTAAGLEIIRDCCQLLHTVPSCGTTDMPGCAAFVKV